MKILHVSYHVGTMNDIQYVCDTIGNITIEHFNPVEDEEIKKYIYSIVSSNWDLYISKEMAKKYGI